MQICKTCLYFYKLLLDPAKAEVANICRRYPPAPGQGVAGTHEDYWCGEWKNKTAK